MKQDSIRITPNDLEGCFEISSIDDT